MNWAWDQSLAPTAKLILMALADAADDVGECWPSLRRISSKCLVSERTVQRALKEFEHGGLLSVRPRFAHDGRQKSNVYFLIISGAPVKLSPPSSGRQGVGVTHVTPGVTESCRGEGDKAMSSLEPPKEALAETPPEPQLRWPAALPRTQRVEIEGMVKAVDCQVVQQMLDELSAALAVPGTIRTTPARWIVGLIRRHERGDFSPTICRPSRAVVRVAKTKTPPDADQPHALPSDQVRQRLEQVTRSLRAKASPGA